MKYYSYNDEHTIICNLCKHYCKLNNGRTAKCGINKNVDGKLVNLTYNHPSTIHIDPIEKKPLYHFLPGTKSLSIGTVGCNFRCPFCQNYTISQTKAVDESIVYTPQDLVDIAVTNGVESISYTYNEPTTWYPYAKDIGILAKKKGIKNVFVSSGYESKEVFEDMQSWVDAANIDLKSFSYDYYQHVLKTKLDGVLDTLKSFAKSDIWLEITTLIIPGVNDSDEEIDKMAEFIACNLGIDVPWHFSAFHPDYKMLDTPNTSLESLQRVKSIAKGFGIKHVYIGNVRNDNSTYCAKCNAQLIKREGFHSHIEYLEDSKCSTCNESIKGIWL